CYQLVERVEAMPGVRRTGGRMVVQHRLTPGHGPCPGRDRLQHPGELQHLQIARPQANDPSRSPPGWERGSRGVTQCRVRGHHVVTGAARALMQTCTSASRYVEDADRCEARSHGREVASGYPRDMGMGAPRLMRTGRWKRPQLSCDLGVDLRDAV